MQAQMGHSEPEPDETTDTVVFRPKAKMVKFRRAFVAFICLAAVFELSLGVMGILTHDPALAALGGLLFLIVTLTAGWFIRQNNAPRMKPIIMLSPEGFTIESAFLMGTMPWGETVYVQPGTLLGVPCVKIMPKNKAALRTGFGTSARFLWMYWMPGGSLGISCIPFSMSPVDLAARINRYRERGL